MQIDKYGTILFVQLLGFSSSSGLQILRLTGLLDSWVLPPSLHRTFYSPLPLDRYLNCFPEPSSIHSLPTAPSVFFVMFNAVCYWPCLEYHQNVLSSFVIPDGFLIDRKSYGSIILTTE